MYIELIDLLRCPREHEESWLVAAFNKMEGRFVIDGKLGCPVCGATYPIIDGIADMRSEPAAPADVSTSSDAVADEAAALRFAAMLGLTRPGSVAVLCGTPASIPGFVAEMASSRVVGVNPVTVGSDEIENVAIVFSDDRLPFAQASVDGILIDGSGATEKVAEALRVLRAGGRLVVPSETLLAGNVRELARDDRYIVAESVGPLVGLSR